MDRTAKGKWGNAMKGGMDHRNHSTVKNEHGLTLVETLAALTIAVMILGAVYGVLINGMNAYSKQRAETAVKQDADVVMTTITRTFYEQQGHPFPLDVSSEGRIVVNGQVISAPDMDYNGSRFQFDAARKTLEITLVVRPSDRGPSEKALRLVNTLYYPW